MPEPSELKGEVAGVPYVALPPEQAVERAPMVVAWHLASPPRSETAMAAALPLRGLQAWRLYLGLPLLGRRLPGGGLDLFVTASAIHEHRRSTAAAAR